MTTDSWAVLLCLIGGPFLYLLGGLLTAGIGGYLTEDTDHPDFSVGVYYIWPITLTIVLILLAQDLGAWIRRKTRRAGNK